MLTPEQQKLVEDNMGLAVYFLNTKNLLNFPDSEDYLQDAYEYLCLAAERFNPDSGVKFGTYAYHAIRNNFLKKWRMSTMQKRIAPEAFSLDSPVRSKVGEHFASCGDTIPDERISDEYFDDKALCSQVMKKASNVLNERNLSVFIDRIYRNDLFQEIADKHQISRQAAHQRYKKAVCKVRRSCAGMRDSA